MTTAHRPTYNPSRGKDTILPNPSLQYSARDLPANTVIKYRRAELLGNASKEEMIMLLRKRERESMLNQDKDKELEVDVDNNDDDEVHIKQSLQINGDINNNDEEYPEIVNVFEQDKDYEYSDNSDNESNNNSLDSEQELLIELEKIKQAQKEEKEREELEQQKQSELNILKSNPLLNQSIDNVSSVSEGYSLKKKWYEDTVFKNQSKLEQKVKKRFINDTVRSDFHRKFLNKTVQ